MRFLNWLKSLFSKSTPANPVAPITSKGWLPEWSEHVEGLIRTNLASFDKASDITKIRSDWSSLTEDQKVMALGQFMKALAYYESGYDPSCESVDVGTKGNKETWSVGLLQLSGVDKKNLGLEVGYDYEGLKNPFNNLNQGIAIFVNQIAKRGKIIIPKSEKGNPGVYFATLNPGNKYDKSEKIIAAAQIQFPVKEKAEVLPEAPISKETLPEKPVATDFTPWMRIAHMEIGVTEAKNPKRVIEYHQATTLKAKDVSTPWCSAWLCWVLQQAGYKTTKSAWARDWLKYGEIADLQEGCIVVMERNGPGGDSHVGFYTGKQTATHIELLSGNSSNSVCLKMYPKKDLLGTRWPIKA